MPDIISSILFDFTSRVRDLIGDELSKVIVYASYACGDYHENSDVDVMVLVKLNEHDIKKIASDIYNLAYDIELEKGIHVSVVIKNEEQFEYWVDTLPFYRNVSQDYRKKCIANSNALAYNKSNLRSLRFVGFVNGGSFVSWVHLHRIGFS